MRKNEQLEIFNKEVGELTELLISTKATERKRAATSLGKMQAQAAIFDLIDALNDDDKTVVLTVIKVLGELGSPDSIPALMEILAGCNSDTCPAAEAALNKIDPQWQNSQMAQGEISRLIAFLNTCNSPGRIFTINKLRRLRDPKAIPAISQFLTDGDPRVRNMAMITLRDLEDSDTISVLIKGLIDESAYVRRTAKESLSQIDFPWRKSKQAQDAIPFFIRALKDKCFSVRAIAAKVLGKLQSQEAIPSLIQSLADEKSQDSQTKVIGLRELRSKEAVPIGELNYTYFYVIRAAATALSELKAQAAIPELVRILKKGDRRVVDTLEKALDKIDPNWRQKHQ